MSFCSRFSAPSSHADEIEKNRRKYKLTGKGLKVNCVEINNMLLKKAKKKLFYQKDLYLRYQQAFINILNVTRMLLKD